MLLETTLLWLIVVKACIPVLNITHVNLRMLRLIKLNITQVSLKKAPVSLFTVTAQS